MVSSAVINHITTTKMDGARCADGSLVTSTSHCSLRQGNYIFLFGSGAMTVIGTNFIDMRASERYQHLGRAW